jgi:hypothetical protein
MKMKMKQKQKSHNKSTKPAKIPNRGKMYFTHYRYGRPFLVCIKSRNVAVYRVPAKVKLPPKFYMTKEKEQYKFADYYSELVAQFQPRRIFIGVSVRSDLTKNTFEYGKKITGNSILLEIANNSYVFIGESIFSFKSIAPITKYVSSVGYNDTPIPHAIDKRGNYYLLLDGVVVNFAKTAMKKISDPHIIYWDAKKAKKNKNKNKKIKMKIAKIKNIKMIAKRPF